MPATADVSAIGCLFSFLAFTVFSVVPIAVLYLLASLFSNFKRKSVSDQLNRFCENWLGLPRQRTPRRIKSWPSVETMFNGHPLRIRTRQKGGKKKVVYSRFELELPNASGLAFAITSQDLVSDVGRLLGMQDAEIGDEVFDNSFVVKTNSHERLREILTEPIRASLLEKLQNTDSLKLEQGKIIFETAGEFQDARFNDRFFQMMILAEKIGDLLVGGSGDVPDSLLQPQRISRQQRRQTFSGAIEAIAREWPDDEKYLKRLGLRMQAVPFMEDDHICFTTNIKGRRVVSRYWHETDPKILTISVAVTQKFWLRIVPQEGTDLTDEIQTGDEWLDGKFRIHSDQHDAALRFLNSPAVRKEFWSIHPFDELEINKGNATYTLHNPRDTGFLHSAFEQTLNRLNLILKDYEEQRLNLLISALQTESSFCPYCREELDPNKDMIATCNLCKTSHHETCLAENKKCTTWGCLATEKDFSHSMIVRERGSGSELETN